MSVALLLQLALQEIPDMSSKYEFVYNFCSDMAGEEYVEFNNSSFLRERSSSDRNYALSHFMNENGCFPKVEEFNVKKIMDMYFQLSSIEINCDSGSVIAATLANNGVCPVTDKQVIRHDTVRCVEKQMLGCGMKNYSGKFAFDVGLPAKSGVSGVILVVIPGVMGICLWSPPLDKFGNSVRGIAFCKEFVNQYHFHKFDDVGDGEKINPIVGEKESSGKTIIQNLMAAAAGDLKFLQSSWLKGNDLDAGDYDGRTPLHLAAAEGRLEVVKFLVNMVKVNPYPTDRWSRIPLEEAKLHKRDKVVQFLDHYQKSTPLILPDIPIDILQERRKGLVLSCFCQYSVTCWS